MSGSGFSCILPAYLNWGTMDAGNRPADSLEDFKHKCSLSSGSKPVMKEGNKMGQEIR